MLFAFLVVLGVLVFLLINHTSSTQGNSGRVSVKDINPTTSISSLNSSKAVNRLAKQGACLEGYYSFENNQFSLCYPKDLITFLDENIVDPEGKGMVAGAIDIIDPATNESFQVIPKFSGTGTLQDPCISRVRVSVSGVQAEREVHREKTSSGCGNVIYMSTMIPTGKAYPFWIIYQGGTSHEMRYIDNYPIVEQSLQIKN